MPAFGELLDLPGPVLEKIASLLRPAARKIFRLTCKDARQLVDRTVQSATVDVRNVRVLCGPWRPLHITFPQLQHLTVALRSTGAVAWDVIQPSGLQVVRPSAVASAASSGGGGCGSSRRGSGRSSDGPAAAAASFSLRLLRDSVPRLKRLRSIDLTQCYLDPKVWSAFCSITNGGLPRGLVLRLHPAAALPFPGRTWGERLGAMLGQLAATHLHVRVMVVACGAGGGGGLGPSAGHDISGGSGGGAACWCDVDGESGLMKLAMLQYMYELPVCVWSRAPCQPTWLGPLSGLSHLQRLHITCHNITDPWDHAWLGGLSAIASLRELDLGRTDSPLSLADIAPLSACTALTALSIGVLAAAAPPQLPFAGGGVGAAPMVAGLLPLPLPPAAPRGAGGGAAAAAVTPLAQVRRLEIRCCLSSGPLPLGELVPRAVSISMCALSVGCSNGGGGRTNGVGGHGGHAISGHVLESLLLTPPPPATPAAAAPPPPPPRLPNRCLPLCLLLPRLHAMQLQQPRQPAPQDELEPPVTAGPFVLLPPPQLRDGLRFLELVQRNTAAITLRPAAQSTGCSPLPDTARLAELKGLEHLQLTGWQLPGAQLPALLAAAQDLPRLRRLTLRSCDAQCFGWRASRALARLELGLGVAHMLRPLESLARIQLLSLQHVEVLDAPNLRLLEQLVVACRMPQLRRLELYGVRNWDDRAFQRILGTVSRAAAAAAAAGKLCSKAEVLEAATATTNTATTATTIFAGDVGGGIMRLLIAPKAAAAHATMAAGPHGSSRRCAGRRSDISPIGELPPRLPAAPEMAATAMATATAAVAATVVLRCILRGCGAAAEHEALKPYGTGTRAEAAAAAEKRSVRPRRTLSVPHGGGDGGGSGRSGSRRWPRLSYIAVHDCPGTSLEDLKREAFAAGLGPWLEVDWMENGGASAAGREMWAAGEPSGEAEGE